MTPKLHLGDTVAFMRHNARQKTYGRILAFIDRPKGTNTVRVLADGCDLSIDLPHDQVELYRSKHAIR